VSLRLEVADRIALPGQHYVLRLTAEDGYTATRSYSVASEPAQELVELFVERLQDGEVSGFLTDVVEVGDELEVRGPVGGWFVWDGSTPALGVGGVPGWCRWWRCCAMPGRWAAATCCGRPSRPGPWPTCLRQPS